MKYLVGLLTLIIMALGYFAWRTNAQLEECKKVPDFRNAILETTKFVGFEKSFHFKLICKKDQEIDHCETKIFEDITGESIALKPEFDRSIFSSSFVIDWIEKCNFYVDLSNSNDWEIRLEDKKIIFNSPDIEIEQIINHNAYLAYIGDRRIWADDEDILLKLALKAPQFSSRKSREYLKEHETEIQEKMESRIEGFIIKIIEDLGYEKGFDVEVNFKT